MKPRRHELKCWPEFFAPVRDGRKTFEVRADDRGFLPGDELVLREWNPVFQKYTGRELTRRISYLLRLQFVPGMGDYRGNLVVLGLAQ